MNTVSDQLPMPPQSVNQPGKTRQRSSSAWIKGDALLNGYVILFFLYMFLPLMFMVIAAFNSSPTPSVTDWQGFTTQWFEQLPQDARFMQGLWHSVLIAVGVILISIPMGLSGAFIMTRLQSSYTNLLYGVLVSPVLIPGIVLGATTMIFWRDMFDVQAGIFTTIMAHSSFIAAYCMLMFMARLQRQDRALEEAALDLGASSALVFRRITLPFLKPTILSASLIAFLQSFENYNTTFFAIGSSWTLVTEIGSRMRFGLSPMINAIGVIFVVITVIVAITHTVMNRKKKT